MQRTRRVWSEMTEDEIKAHVRETNRLSHKRRRLKDPEKWNENKRDTRTDKPIPDKQKARIMANKYLAQQPCEICDRWDAERHHSDHTWPLTVLWLCPEHHAEWHRLHDNPWKG